MNILALDVGTSSVKAAVVDQASGNPLAFPTRVGYDHDRPGADAAEVPAERFWAAVSNAARKAMQELPAEKAPPEAVGLSCMTPALVLLDASDRPLSPIWTHLDRRGRDVARRVQEEAGDEFLNAVGTRPLPGGTSAIWFAKQCEADRTLASRTRHYLHANGWLAFRLTGERAFDPANASFTGLFGTCTDQQWSPRWCERFRVNPDWLPAVRDGTTTLGELRSEVAAEWGVKAGLPVKLGTADTSSAMLGARLGPNDLLHSVGTTQVLAVFTETPQPDPRRLTRLFGVGKRFVSVTHNPVGGSALEWIHHLCFHEQSASEFYRKTIFTVADHSTTVELDPPFLGGDRLEIEPQRARFTNLSLGVRREDLLAAVLEGMRNGHSRALAALDRDPGSLHCIFLTGGGADVVRKLLPEYSGADVRRIEEGPLRGIARLFDQQ